MDKIVLFGVISILVIFLLIMFLNRLSVKNRYYFEILSQLKTPTINLVSTINVPIIDVEKYVGTWYEILRTPNDFQNYCKKSVAKYEISDDINGFKVTNSCSTESGNIITVTGKAVCLEGNVKNRYVPGRFNVSFDNNNTTDPNYNVLIVVEDYDNNKMSYLYSMVGSSDLKHLWILSRTGYIDSTTVSKFLQYAQKLGFDTKELIVDQDYANFYNSQHTSI